MDRIFEEIEEFTKEGKERKVGLFDKSEQLTPRQKKRGSLKGKVRYYSEALKCYFYLKPGIDFEMIEKKYLERELMITR